MSSYCYVYITGGLGNQLFQIATGMAYAKRTGKIFRILIKGNNERGFHWNETLVNFQQYLTNQIEKDAKYYAEPCFNYREIPHVEGNIVLDGYFQSSKYFSNITVDNLFINHWDKLPKNYVIVHARRGDYCRDAWMISFHNPQPDSYYERAKKYVSERIEKPKYILLSDDQDYWKNSEVFKGEDHEIMNENMYDTLGIMVAGNNFIMSNSTFAWWGVYLSGRDGIVIAPKDWFGPSFHQSWSDIYEDDFVIL